jgi:hypothetical protein
MDGGMLIFGDSTISSTPNVINDAIGGNSWWGHEFTNCEVKIYNTAFSNLEDDSTYAINTIDCPLVDIRWCTFNCGEYQRGINCTYINEEQPDNIYIYDNTFTAINTSFPQVNVMSYAGMTTPLLVESNLFNTTNGGNTAILLSGVTGGAIKSNTITDYSIG